MTRHVSAERLARFRSGDLGRSATRRVRRHLDGCSRCRETEAALATVPRLLAGIQPPQIPAHLAARIETALATEAAHRAAGSPSMRSGAARLPGPAAHRRSRPALPGPALRVLTAAAVIVVIGGGGFELVSHLGGGTTGASSSSGSASRPSAEAPRGTAHSVAGGRVNAPSAVGAGPAFGPAVPYRRGGRLATIRPVRTATNYEPAQLAAQVRGTLAQTARIGAGRPAASKAAASNAAGFGAVQLSRLAGCVSRVAAGADVRLVDVARFRGTPATVIVTAAPQGGTGSTAGSATGSTAERIWVVGAQCSRSGSDVLAQQPLPG
jgi:Putative zinc-finger